MNSILVFQLFSLTFWIIPYFAMMVYQLDPEEKIVKTVLSVLAVPFVGFFIYHLWYEGKIMFRGLHALMLLYLLFWVLSTQLYRETLNLTKALAVGFIISYVTSFYWEIPINVYDLMRKGLHGSLPGHILGLFPLIWLIKHSRVTLKKNISLIVFGLIPTTIGIFVYGDLSQPVNMLSLRYGVLLFCRTVSFMVLCTIFPPEIFGEKKHVSPS